MKALVVGATGATGKLLVEQLLQKGVQVCAIVRSTEKLSHLIDGKCGKQLQVIQGTLLDFSDDQLQEYSRDCDAILSCLGHNMNFRGLFLSPWYLVRDSIQRLCAAVEKNQQKTKIVVMNTVGVNDPSDLSTDPPRGLSERCVLGLLYYLLIPQTDNWKTANFLNASIGKENSLIEWCVVRPDDLVDEPVSQYDVYPGLQTGLFEPNLTSRSNVAHFMCSLATDPETWNCWKNRFPVILNRRVEQ